MLASIFLFAALFPLNLWHFRVRRIPLYSAGTTIAVIHIAAGCVSFLLVPVVALLTVITVEAWHAGLSRAERDAQDHRFIVEEQTAAERIAKAQHSYEQLHCLITFLGEQEWELRAALKHLDAAGVEYFLRNGLITSVLIRPADRATAEAALGIVADPLDARDGGEERSSAASTEGTAG